MTAAVDIAAVAKRLSANQREVLAFVRSSSVYRSQWNDICRLTGSMATVTRTVEALVRRELVQPPDPGNTCVLTDLGRAVLDHLTALQSDRGEAGRGVAMFFGIVAFVAVMLACFGNWDSW